MSRRLLVLCWHNVAGTSAFPGPAEVGTAARRFARQVRWLDRVATVVPLGQALAALDAGRPLPPRAVALTFDDGYADTLSLALPVLERHRLPATVFLVLGLLDGESAWWERTAEAFDSATCPELEWEGRRWPTATPGQRRSAYAAVAARLKLRSAAGRAAAVDDLVERLAPAGRISGQDLFLDWGGARELVARGVEIGSHTCAHAILSRESREDQHVDLARARQVLSARLSVPVDLLAYPNGTPADYDASTLAAAAAAGHSAALTTRAGLVGPSSPRLELPRVVVDAAGTGRQLARQARWAVRAARTST